MELGIVQGFEVQEHFAVHQFSKNFTHSMFENNPDLTVIYISFILVIPYPLKYEEGQKGGEELQH